MNKEHKAPLGEEHWDYKLNPISKEAKVYSELMFISFGEKPAELLEKYEECECDLKGFFEVVGTVLSGKAKSPIDDFTFKDDGPFVPNTDITFSINTLSGYLMLALINRKHNKEMTCEVLLAGSKCTKLIYETVKVYIDQEYQRKQIMMSLGINKLYVELFSS